MDSARGTEEGILRPRPMLARCQNGDEQWDLASLPETYGIITLASAILLRTICNLLRT